MTTCTHKRTEDHDGGKSIRRICLDCGWQRCVKRASTPPAVWAEMRQLGMTEWFDPDELLRD